MPNIGIKKIQIYWNILYVIYFFFFKCNCLMFFFICIQTFLTNENINIIFSFQTDLYYFFTSLYLLTVYLCWLIFEGFVELLWWNRCFQILIMWIHIGTRIDLTSFSMRPHFVTAKSNVQFGKWGACVRCGHFTNVCNVVRTMPSMR